MFKACTEVCNHDNGSAPTHPGAVQELMAAVCDLSANLDSIKRPTNRVGAIAEPNRGVRGKKEVQRW